MKEKKIGNVKEKEINRKKKKEKKRENVSENGKESVVIEKKKRKRKKEITVKRKKVIGIGAKTGALKKTEKVEIVRKKDNQSQKALPQATRTKNKVNSLLKLYQTKIIIPSRLICLRAISQFQTLIQRK